MRYGEAGQSHLLPFLGAAALFAALTITAHSVVLGLAAVIAGPVPAAQTALSLSRKAVSGAAQEEAASMAEAAPESTGTAASLPEAAAPTGGIESYLVELLGDDARPEGAGAVIEKNYPQGSGEKYVACGAGSIKNNTRQTAADIAAEIQAPLPFGVEKDSPDPQILIMHTHATEDYRLSAGLWYSPGDGARTTDTNLNMCAVGRVMADTLNAAGLNTLHDETLNDYPNYTGSYENSRAVVQRYLAQYPSIKVVLDVHRDAIETEGGSRMAPVCTVDGRQAAQVMIICGCDNGGSVRLPDVYKRQHLLFLQRILVGGAVAQDLYAVSIQLKGLLCLRGQHDAAHDAQAAVQAGVDDLIVVCQLAGFQHDLQGLEAAAVGQGDKADVLGVADVLCPAAYGDDRTIGGGVLVQRNDLSAFHFQITSDIK